MKRKLFTLSAVITGVFILCSAALAHHGTGISYDLTKPPLVLKGTVTEFKWANPHIAIFLDVRDEKGNVVNWSIEGNSPFNYIRMGFNRNTLKVGEQVTAYVYPSLVAGVAAGVIAKVVLPSGREVLRFQRDFPGQEVR